MFIDIVILGLMVKNENNSEEMLDIMKILHKYVPGKGTTGKQLKHLQFMWK